MTSKFIGQRGKIQSRGPGKLDIPGRENESNKQVTWKYAKVIINDGSYYDVCALRKVHFHRQRRAQGLPQPIRNDSGLKVIIYAASLLL